MGAMFFASAVIQLPTGVLFDWIGPRRSLTYLGVVAILAGVLVVDLAEQVARPRKRLIEATLEREHDGVGVSIVETGDEGAVFAE